ncbi:MAG: hypothetical protein Q8O19_03595, partial [Rectinemataceae bacterium]|nr:hypothetical protein [Rectinemataceae bacterium]
DGKRIWNFMEGQAISQIASVVLGLSREEMTNAACSDRHDGISYKLVEIMKTRSGKSGGVRMRYNMDLTSIEQAS